MARNSADKDFDLFVTDDINEILNGNVSTTKQEKAVDKMIQEIQISGKHEKRNSTLLFSELFAL